MARVDHEAEEIEGRAEIVVGLVDHEAEETEGREAKALHAEIVVALAPHDLRAVKVVLLVSGPHVRLVRGGRVVPVRREIEVRAPRALIVRRARLLMLQRRRNKPHRLCLPIPVIDLLRLSKVRRVQRSSQRAKRGKAAAFPLLEEQRYAVVTVEN